MSILFYKKPEFSKTEGSLAQSSCQRYVERAASSTSTIPEELSFRNVIEDRALPPCGLQDFLDYLIYVSHDAENLQFYLWYKDYCKRFNTAPAWKKELAPMWTDANQARSDIRTTELKIPSRKFSPTHSPLPSPLPSPMPKLTKKPLPLAPSPLQQFKEFSFQPHEEVHLIPTKSLEERLAHPIDVTDNMSEISVDEKTRDNQPFREEVARIADHYLRVGAPRELNLSSRERDDVLRAVEQTTHPTAFLEVAALVETTLRYHSHRNFIRWSICNGNKPRVFVLRSLAIFVLSCTVALAFLLILSHFPRWYRISVIPICFFASVNLIAARQGLCVLLHRRRTREARPWEIHDSNTTASWRSDAPSYLESGRTSRNTSERRSTFGPSNSFDDEPWVDEWEARTPWQRIRIQKIKVGPGGLRNVQDRILWQAEGWGLLVTLVFTGVVCAFPVFALY